MYPIKYPADIQAEQAAVGVLNDLLVLENLPQHSVTVTRSFLLEAQERLSKLLEKTEFKYEGGVYAEPVHF